MFINDFAKGKLTFTFSSLSGNWSLASLPSGARGSLRRVQCLSVCPQQSASSLWGFHTLTFTAVYSTSRAQKILPLVRGSWYPRLSRSCVWGFCFFLQACGTGTVEVKLMGETETAFCADLEDFWSLIKLSIHFWERNNNLEKENPPGDVLSHSLCIWETCETVNLVRTSPSLLKEK